MLEPELGSFGMVGAAVAGDEKSMRMHRGETWPAGSYHYHDDVEDPQEGWDGIDMHDQKRSTKSQILRTLPSLVACRHLIEDA